MERRRSLVAVGGTIAVHALLFLSWKSSPRVASVAPIPVTVERTGRSGSGRGAGAGAGAGAGRAGRLGMSDLLVKGGEGVGSGRGNRKGSGVGQGTYDALPFEGKVPLIPLFEALWARLDSAVDYPKELVDNRVEGSVSLRFTVDDRGALASDVTLVHADSTVLEAYVLSVVASTLERGFEGPRRARRDRTPVQLQVNFRTSTEIRSQERNPGGVRGNALTLHRSSYVPPYVDEVVERVFRKYVPPIFPLPGGFYVDVVRLVAFLEGLDAPDPDDLRTVRLEGFKRRFLRANR